MTEPQASTDWSKVDRESLTCPMCAHPVRRKVHTTGKFAHFNLVKCAQCGFHYLNPRPTESALLEHYAQDDYFEGDAGGYASYAAQADALRLTFQALLKQLKRRNMTGENLLEIGCGYGFLLKEARPYFKIVHATDFSAGALEKAGSFADQTYQGGLDVLPKDARYETVIANHVVEHVHDPKRFVEDCKARLKSGGWLLLSTPDAGSFWFKLMGKRWPSFIVPDHLLYFSQRHLRRLLEEAGLVDLQTIPYPHAFPLSLIGQKLGLNISGKLGQRSLWMPKTTIAVAGRLP